MAQEPGSSDGGASPAAIASSEAARRAQIVKDAETAIGAGDVFLQAGEYTKALDRYQFALKTIAPDGPTASDYARARIGVARVKLQQADAARKSGDFDQAAALIQEAVATDNGVALEAQKEDLLIRADRKRYNAQRVNPESTTNNPVITPEFKNQVAQVQKLLFEGDRFFETGQYDQAEERYRQILTIDAYNAAARLKMARVDRYRKQAAQAALVTTRDQAIYDVERRWTPKEMPTQQAGGAETAPATESRVAFLTNKLNTVKIDNISFVNQPVGDAIQILRDKAKAADPTGEGFNIVYKLTPTVVTPPASSGAAGAAPAPAAPADAATPASNEPPSVTMSLNNVSVAEVLNVLQTLTNLKYKVEEYAIFILPSNESSDVLVTRTFVVPTGFFESGLAASRPAAGASTSATTVDSVKVDVQQQLKDQGVAFPSGATAAFLAASSRLVVKNTPEQMDRIDSLLQASAQEADPQIEIETKFAEFSDTNLRELAFNWGLSLQGAASAPVLSSISSTTMLQSAGGGPSGSASKPIYEGQTALRTSGDLQPNSLDALLQTTSGNGSANSAANFLIGGTLGNKGFAVLATLIDQMKGVDLLSAPKVTTKNRAAAKIEIDRQMTYPNQFAAPQYNTTPVQYNGQATILITPPTPSSFDKASIGVVMDVTPTAYPDRRIDLDLKPQVIDFEGFIDYGSTIQVGSQGFSDDIVSVTPLVITPITPEDSAALGGTNITPLEIYKIRQPVFNNRKITTKIQVIDGQTVVMGGLVREDTQVLDDKVPVLGDMPLIGRLFRSKVDQKIKKNLLIFITARIILPTGKVKYTAAGDAPPITVSSAGASAGTH